MQSSPPSAEAVPTGANLFRTPGCALGQRKRHERTNSTGTGKRVFRKTTAGTKSSAMHEKSTPAGCPQRDALPLLTSGSRMQGQLLEGEREREQRKGRAGSLFIFPNQRYPYHRTGTGMAVTCRASTPLLFSPDFVPRTQKGPLAGALVSFSLIRPEPDTVIGTTRRFQPWRELPSWLRAGGSVR